MNSKQRLVFRVHAIQRMFGRAITKEDVRQALMECVVCKQGETEAGHTTVTLERDQTVLVFRNVPAEVCANCGEAYVSEEITAQLLEEAEEAVRARVQVDVRELDPMAV